MSEVTEVSSISLAHHFSDDNISVTYIEKPHGEYSDPVIKLNIKEFGKPAGEVEIPYDNVNELINALENTKEIYAQTTHPKVHAELGADIGGGQ